MPPKTLSNGTLALKFMQKAALKSQSGGAPVVELHKAKVADEAEWDVGLEVRRAWGLAPNGDNTAGPSGSSSSGVVYETSYLPFLYGQAEDDATEDDEEAEVSQSLLATTASRPGRWSNLKIEEPKAKTEPRTQDDGTADKPNGDLEQSTSPQNPPLSSPDPDPSSSKKKGKRKLEENEDVEPPLLPSSSSNIGSEGHATGFLRPAGVDAPSAHAPIAHDGTAPKKKKKKKYESVV
ncbi:hypothetical protein FRC04_006341 [Tulasnella sp. 424]|nr:hypothetical protein FRC04_006341 [Tulasnella sp. 424]KAG8980393.1 hypothetical protein FRC05_006024 [Tulasnella sp. 425]